jgi:thiosulfate reductase cytochrome b subunit
MSDVSSVDAIGPPRHAPWVRLVHWVAAASILTLATSGVAILMVHPRLYWGETGNDLTPALIELPISRNHRHGGWTAPQPFFDGTASPVSAGRTFEIFNQNGWARSLHFLAAWCLVLPGLAYLMAGISGGHFARHLVPRTHDLARSTLGRDLVDHLRLRIPPARGGPAYGPLQKIAYTVVVFGLAPLVGLTGVAMSPAVTAAYPWLSALFGGYQSARTIHFAAFAAVTLFLCVHVAMVIASGFARQLRGMTVAD